MHCSFPSDIRMEMEDIDMMMNNCSNMSMGGMRMQFYFGLLPGGLLFTGWTIKTVGEMVGSIIVVLAMGMVYEGLKTLREFLMKVDGRSRRRKKSSVHLQSPDETTPLFSGRARETSWMTAVKSVGKEYLNVFHILQSILHVVQVGLGYLLMLVAMTYNGWLFLAVIFGAGVGYFIFAVWRKKLSAAKSFEEQNEHCT